MTATRLLTLLIKDEDMSAVLISKNNNKDSKSCNESLHNRAKFKLRFKY